jgi:hypothetical protein
MKGGAMFGPVSTCSCIAKHRPWPTSLASALHMATPSQQAPPFTAGTTLLRDPHLCAVPHPLLRWTCVGVEST